MTQNSKIQWTDHTFNPWRGCTKVAAGCTNCYAETTSKRNPGTLGIWGDEGSRVVAAESQWKQVEKWETFARMSPELGRPRVFVASLADVFEDWDGPMVDSNGENLVLCRCGFWGSHSSIVRHANLDCPAASELPSLKMSDVRARLFRLIDDCPNLDFLLLTKRPENIRKFWPEHIATSPDQPRSYDLEPDRPVGSKRWGKRFENVWLITSIANQEDADRNIPHLLSCRDLSPVLGVSAEPLVGPVTLTEVQPEGIYELNALTGASGVIRPLAGEGPHLDWVIVGGESGPNARPYNIDWARAIIRQCKAAGVPVFHKQLGAKPVIECRDGPDGPGQYRLRKITDPKGGDMSEWSEELKIREFPVTQT